MMMLMVLITSLLDKVIAILITPDFIDTHGELVVSVSHNCLKVKLLIIGGLIVCRLAPADFVIIFERLFLFENFIKVGWLHLTQTHQSHMDSLVVRVGCELVLAIFVVQISDVIVANARCFVVLAAKEHACLS